MTKLERVRSDVLACIYNYYYEGWKYRLELGETHEAIAADCNKAAATMLKEYDEEKSKEN